MNEKIKTAKESFGKIIFNRRRNSVEQEEVEDATEEKKSARELKKPELPHLRKVAPCERKVLSRLRKQSQPEISKKEMMKDWNRNYEEMCQRAQVLKLAIESADKNELEVKPVTRIKSTNSRRMSDKQEEPTKRKNSKDVESGSFFSLHSTSTMAIATLEKQNSNDETLQHVASDKKSRRLSRAQFMDTQSLDRIDVVSLEHSASLDFDPK